MRNSNHSGPDFAHFDAVYFAATLERVTKELRTARQSISYARTEFESLIGAIRFFTRLNVPGQHGHGSVAHHDGKTTGHHSPARQSHDCCKDKSAAVLKALTTPPTAKRSAVGN